MSPHLDLAVYSQSLDRSNLPVTKERCMTNRLRTALAVVLGLAIGGAVNMGIILSGPLVIPPPDGVDMTTTEGLKAGIALLEPRHFIGPFLAHALGTFVGAFVAASIALTNRSVVAYAIGILFLAGGISASTMIPAPAWFIALDLIVAYIPMAWLGLQLARQPQPSPAM